MFTPAYARAANAYKRVRVETGVPNADPHHLVHLLFEELLQAVSNARGSLARKQIPEKCASISRAVRILDEGLKASLNTTRGGELADNLSFLYEYCIKQLTLANVQNDDSALAEVRKLIEPLAQAWAQISPAELAKAKGAGAKGG
jgi:flagellar secretion chaperone FliS